MKLTLGVIEQPYQDSPGVTTGDVAEILEAKYHPMEIFYEVHQQEVADDLAEGFAGTLESMLKGAPVDPADLFLSGTAKIDAAFKNFLLTGEMESLGIPGVPTKAAVERRSLRFKKKRGPSKRPSFIDTGLYESNFKSWIEPN